MSRRHELQKMAAQAKPISDEEKVLALYRQDIYHLKGIAKLTGIGYQKVRKIVNDHNGGVTRKDTNGSE